MEAENKNKLLIQIDNIIDFNKCKNLGCNNRSMSLDNKHKNLCSTCYFENKSRKQQICLGWNSTYCKYNNKLFLGEVYCLKCTTEIKIWAANSYYDLKKTY